MGYHKQTVSIDAGRTREINVIGRAFSVLSATGTIEVSFDNDSYSEIFSGLTIVEQEPFKKVSIKNTSGGTVSVEFGISTGTIIDARLVLASSEIQTLDVTSSSNVSTQKSTGNGTHDFIPSSGTRKLVTVENQGTVYLYWVGDSAVSGAAPYGIRIAPGATATFNTRAAIHFYQDTSGGSNSLFCYSEEF